MNGIFTTVTLTDHHARLFAHELERRCASGNVKELAAVLDAHMDLNPHQVEAALFTFQSPFSKGAILADDVGTGKTIEACLLVVQRWAGRRRRMLVVVPTNLYKRWSQEFEGKLRLPPVILETRTFNDACFNALKQRLQPICKRTLRRQALEYVKFTNWHILVQEFISSPGEQWLYDLVSAYLQRQALLEEQTARNGRWFNDEMDKLERWAEDRRATLKGLDCPDQEIKDARKAAWQAGALPEKLERQAAIGTLEANQDMAWRTFDQASQIDRQKDDLLDESARPLEQQTECTELFTARWRVA